MYLGLPLKRGHQGEFALVGARRCSMGAKRWFWPGVQDRGGGAGLAWETS